MRLECKAPVNHRTAEVALLNDVVIPILYENKYTIIPEL